MITMHHSFSTRIFPAGGPGAREATHTLEGLAGAWPSTGDATRDFWRQGYQSQGLTGTMPAKRGTDRPGANGRKPTHA